MLGFALASAPWMVYPIILVSALGGVAMPAINTLNSNLTPRNAQGELQGAQASMMALTLIFSPLLMTQTLNHFSDPATAPILFPGAAFLLASMITLLAMLPFVIGIGVNRRALARAAAKVRPAE
jgi:DHA1 family tetracycline resistance protein-like MFS transporter